MTGLTSRRTGTMTNKRLSTGKNVWSVDWKSYDKNY